MHQSNSSIIEKNERLVVIIEVVIIQILYKIRVLLFFVDTVIFCAKQLILAHGKYCWNSFTYYKAAHKKRIFHY